MEHPNKLLFSFKIDIFMTGKILTSNKRTAIRCIYNVPCVMIHDFYCLGSHKSHYQDRFCLRVGYTNCYYADVP